LNQRLPDPVKNKDRFQSVAVEQTQSLRKINKGRTQMQDQPAERAIRVGHLQATGMRPLFALRLWGVAPASCSLRVEPSLDGFQQCGAGFTGG
jgi:hypothetical protein